MRRRWDTSLTASGPSWARTDGRCGSRSRCSRATHDALIKATAPRRDGHRAPKGLRLLTGTFFCGNCGARLHVTGRENNRYAYECTARIRGIRASAGCRPAPAMALSAADALVSEWFLARYGPGEVMRKIYDPGPGTRPRSPSWRPPARGCARTGRPGSTMTPRTRTVPHRIPKARGGNHGAEGAPGAQAGHAPGAYGPHHSPGVGRGG